MGKMLPFPHSLKATWLSYFIPDSVSSTKGGTFFPAESQATHSRYPINICQMNESMLLMGWNTPKPDMAVENHVKTREEECENEYILSIVKRKV